MEEQTLYDELVNGLREIEKLPECSNHGNTENRDDICSSGYGREK